jgi:hypothetical protein
MVPHLRDLLFQRHAADEVVNTLFQGQRRIHIPSLSRYLLLGAHGECEREPD